MYSLSVLILAACMGGTKAEGGDTTQSSLLSLDSISDSICLTIKGQDVCAKAKVLFPVNQAEIKQNLTDMLRQLAREDGITGNPDSVNLDTFNIHSLLKYLIACKSGWLKGEAEEITGDLPTPMSYTLDMNLLEETDDYVTFGLYEESLFSGPHPHYSSYGVSYLKQNGKKLGISDLASGKTDEIRKEVQSILKNYFRELTNDDDFDVDAALSLKNEDGSERLIALPEHGFYIKDDSIVFSYQTDEIASYAFGMPEVSLSLLQMKAKGWLGKELSDIVK